jgi:hypothetical protein
MGPLVPRDCKVSKCNFNLLWVVIGIAFVIKNVNWLDFGYCLNNL